MSEQKILTAYIKDPTVLAGFEQTVQNYLESNWKLVNLQVSYPVVIVCLDGPAESLEQPTPTTCSQDAVSEFMKASEVIRILNISRMTLSNYVKRGLIQVEITPTGQYKYKRDSVLKLVAQIK